jgi:uncharacterized repeat protein (TIGR01451 family)
MKILTTLMVLMMVSSTHALAQQQGHLDVTTSVQKEEVTVDESGQSETKLVEANTVVPGDRVIYTITFRNTSEETAENVVITNPIAESLTYRVFGRWRPNLRPGRRTDRHRGRRDTFGAPR